MQDFFEPLLGATGAMIAQFAVWTVAILVILLAGWWLVGRLIGIGRRGFSRGRVPRLAIVDALALDQRRRLVLVRRDNLEHLILIGGSGDVVVETGIHRQKPVTRAAEKRGGDTAHTIALPPMPPRTTTVAAGAVTVSPIPVVAPPQPPPEAEPAPPSYDDGVRIEPTRPAAPHQASGAHFAPDPSEPEPAQPAYGDGVRIEPTRPAAPQQASSAHFAPDRAEPAFAETFDEIADVPVPPEPVAPEPAVSHEPAAPAAPARRLIIPAPVTPADFADGRRSLRAETTGEQELPEPAGPTGMAVSDEAPALDIPDGTPSDAPEVDPHPFAPHRPPAADLAAQTAPMQPPVEAASPYPDGPPANVSATQYLARTAEAAEPADGGAPLTGQQPEAPQADATSDAASGTDGAHESENGTADASETTRVEELRREMSRLLGEGPRQPNQK